jgi:hypothetical protein
LSRQLRGLEESVDLEAVAEMLQLFYYKVSVSTSKLLAKTTLATLFYCFAAVNAPVNLQYNQLLRLNLCDIKQHKLVLRVSLDAARDAFADIANLNNRSAYSLGVTWILFHKSP